MNHAISLLLAAYLGSSLLLHTGVSPLAAADLSSLKPGDALVIMPAAANRSADGKAWEVPLHAWVYVPQTSQVRRTAIEKVLELGYGLHVTAANAAYFNARVNLLLADNKRGRTIVVDAGGVRATLPPTGANGHAQMTLTVPMTTATPEGGRIAIRAVLPAGDKRRIEASAHLVGATGVSVISDIDDTVKVTHVTEKKRMWEATFYKPFEAVNGMPAAYRRLAAQGAAFHYVSSSPWHFTAPLLDFIGASGLPLSSIALKQVRLKDRTALDIVKPGRETKPPQIEAILVRFPMRRFILIGDSGEDDPEIYSTALRDHPDQIERIHIRNVTGARRDDARFAKAFDGIDAKRWVLFDDPKQIEGK
jgi:phosphatidate phosphatase APP1